MMMEEEAKKKKKKDLEEGVGLDGFSFVSSTPPVFWKSRRKRPASVKNTDKVTVDDKIEIDNPSPPEKQHEEGAANGDKVQQEREQESFNVSILSQKRKALFEPLEPLKDMNGQRLLNESLLPPPDFESASYPKGWLVGKKRKLVNVDVVESMRRIAVQEMNRKDREIGGLNEQLEEDARCLEHLQLQLLDERSKRAEVERQNAMLQDQVTMLMNMLEESEPIDENDPMEGEEGEEQQQQQQQHP